MKVLIKNSFLARLGLAAILIVGASSCEKEFLDVNQNPNRPAAVTPAVLLTGIEATTGFAVGNDLNRVSSLLIQHAAGIANQAATYDGYSLRGSFDNQWNGELYGGSLINTRLLIDQSQATNPFYAGIGKLLRAYNFALATDLWGDVPYSQASLGNANLKPRFDAQQDIYQGNKDLEIESLFDLVRSGLADINNPTNVSVPGADDIIYGGDQNNWNKFGNTLLLKLANTISRKNPDLATTVIKEVLAKGADAVITTNAEDGTVAFGTTIGNQNPSYAFNILNRPNDQMLSRRFLDSLRAPKPDDPRLPFFWTTSAKNPASVTTPFGEFTGYDNAGTQAVPILANRSRFGVYQVGESGEAPVQLLTNFQRAFILAESAITLGTAGDAQELFEEGIRASMTKVGVSPTDIAAYFAANKAYLTLSGSNEQRVNRIITQKWIAWCGNGYEPYNDYRRTGYPQLEIVQLPNPEALNKIPRRLFYPNSEITSNTSQAPATLPSVAVPVWWDTRK
ncbi:SusD/RagB family nutrient-binding outer membrane lipoprotein [uncultured Hymenobacter sp.]|uniref:SusD/RagB family nutrient-binding outer membrane lipoprotein n=1 Tax=uncultured Hymenobacter sp. TaxID=170016 RepID=UPI0035CA661A